MKLSKQFAISVIGVSTVLLLGSNSVDAKTAVVDVKSLYLREKPSTSSSMVDGLVKGQELEVIEELEDWYKVEVKGKTGYVSAKYVKVNEEESNTEETNQEENNQEQQVEETKAEENKQEEKKKEEKKQEPEKIKKDFQIKEASLVSKSKAYILPLINSNVLKEINEGVKVTIYDEAGNWYYIQDDEIAGWILKSALGEAIEINIQENDNVEINNEEENQAEENKQEEKQEEQKQEEKVEEKQEEVKQEETSTEEKAITKKLMYVNSASIYVREGPGTDYKSVDSLVLNNSVYVVAEVGDWYKVEFDNVTGYIAKRLLSDSRQGFSRNSDERSQEEEEETVTTEENNIQEETTNEETNVSSASSIGEEIVEFAKQYLGCKYVYGGSGPNTFDCSGFTMYVFNKFGVSLSHSATAQSKVGGYVAKEDLMPGDLVFFKDYETMQGIGHCGIYVGDGNFIHASSGTGYCVKISTLESGSYLKRYETARRIF